MPADEVLVVTFTDKAAGEMAERLAALGQPGVTARTFHAHALSQLRYFWPSATTARRCPRSSTSKIPIVGRLARALPGDYRFTPPKDLADEIEWAKSRAASTPASYEAERDRRAPDAADPGRAVRRASTPTTSGPRSGPAGSTSTTCSSRRSSCSRPTRRPRRIVQARKRWFSVDEYQDTNPLQERLLELWLGDADDLCVVGDADQTIYTFTGATSDYLTGFADRHPGATVIALTENYRRTPADPRPRQPADRRRRPVEGPRGATRPTARRRPIRALSPTATRSGRAWRSEARAPACGDRRSRRPRSRSSSG